MAHQKQLCVQPDAITSSRTTDGGVTHTSDQDDRAMAELGKNATAMANGGPVTLIYGFVYAWLGAATTALSFREMASMYPTAVNTTDARCSPRPLTASPSPGLCCWIASLGWLANTAAGACFAATLIQGVLVEDDPDYGYERWHGTLSMGAVLPVVFVANSIGTRLLAPAEGVVLVLHLAALLTLLIKGAAIHCGLWRLPATLGLAINAFGAIFLVPSVVSSFFPPALPVTAVSRNWSIAVSGAL
ncbi:amino acid permease [Teratosphaeria destructans]|uniref:Amino acid permease n=1 Tax=Teratosphaeria destructans TaxID=418781 RepID=A0A9W7SKH9_9PEZI|nr:amino acid permease [Teratosphaeria destructans]